MGGQINGRTYRPDARSAIDPFQWKVVPQRPDPVMVARMVSRLHELMTKPAGSVLLGDVVVEVWKAGYADAPPPPAGAALPDDLKLIVPDAKDTLGETRLDAMRAQDRLRGAEVTIAALAQMMPAFKAVLAKMAADGATFDLVKIVDPNGAMERGRARFVGLR